MELLQGSERSNLIEDDDAKFSDALEEFPLFDASNSSSASSVSQIDDHTISEQPSSPSSAGLRRRRLFSRQTSKELPWSTFKKSSDGLVDFNLHGSTVSLGKNYKFLWNLKNNDKLNDKLNRTKVRVGSGSDGKRLANETNGSSLSSSVITTVNGDEGAIDDSVTVDSSNPGSSFLFILAGLVIKTIAFQTSLLVGLISFPLWLMYSSYMFLIDPFSIIRRGRSYIKKRISRFLKFCYGNLKWVLNIWIKRNRSTWKFCMQIGWGLLSSAFVGIILVGLLVMGFVISGALMKYILEQPIQKIEQLSFDYTRDTPMAFVPIMSCPEPLCLDCNEKIRFGNAAQSRVIPLDHKLQATVSLTLPESDYNRNLGIFQVRVDFLSSNGKPLLSTIQPCMLPFKSKSLRLLSTVFKLAPLITGYSSESQTIKIKFSGHTETKVPTSCLRVVMEPRAQFASRGGVPEIYTSYLKLESKLPLFKRILWSWKATIFVWTSMVMFTVGLLFVLVIIVPWLWPRGVLFNSNASQNSSQG
ncbi:seipin-2-like [Cynara cardunculus var. scolymus]|uniref:Adipose-regulatory protein, Seipin n=1 Tax=Cynara cardunculus var. scolymus TaxID=59895 RepID=A0A103Y1U4_CYNCS|nr:seipin-2-like [Cynara cardunculus var. scolymus]XP_024983386.1 seipin-2-like [Cynara cardunculus var. scolymus]KVI00952.1 Adipose-regulatory protein, Seipin [Cynara cardunculus var. scolymus]